jgi:Xaa-Pro aminopeptidase
MNFAGRIQRIRDCLAGRQVDAMLVSYLKNIFYLSGFSGSTAEVLITGEDALFLTDSRYYERFAEEVFEEYQLVPFYQESLGRKLKELAGKHELGRLGIEADHLSLTQVEELKGNSGVDIVPLSGVVEKLRIVKDDEEIAALTRAIRLKEEVFTELVGLIRGDVTEADLAAEFEYRLRKKGAQMASFPPIVAFGKNSSKPHATFTDQTLVPTMPLTFDLGVELDGYCSDMTRTIFFGGVAQGWREIYSIVNEAKEAAADDARAGMRCADVDRIARDIICQGGYDSYKVDGDERKYFGHGLGHGVGVEVHEAPRLNNRSEETLEVGSIVTIEPGIYLPDQGGIRIEDMYVVRDNRLVNLNSLPTDILVVE